MSGSAAPRACLESRDAHLCHDLEHTLSCGLDVVANGCLVIDPCELPVIDETLDGRKGHVGVDGIDSKARHHAKVMHLHIPS